jgi:hypothetical protein
MERKLKFISLRKTVKGEPEDRHEKYNKLSNIRIWVPIMPTKTIHFAKDDWEYLYSPTQDPDFAL